MRAAGTADARRGRPSADGHRRQPQRPRRVSLAARAGAPRRACPAWPWSRPPPSQSTRHGLVPRRTAAPVRPAFDRRLPCRHPTARRVPPARARTQPCTDPAAPPSAALPPSGLPQRAPRHPPARRRPARGDPATLAEPSSPGSDATPLNKPLIASCRPVEVRDGVSSWASRRTSRSCARRRSSADPHSRMASRTSSAARSGYAACAPTSSCRWPSTEEDIDLVAQARKVFGGELADVGDID